MSSFPNRIAASTSWKGFVRQGRILLIPILFLPPIAFVAITSSCGRYAETTPRQVYEGDPEWNYRRVFGVSRPPGVSVVHSIVITYSWRPGVVTTDDFEFEILAPKSWIEDRIRDRYLRQSDSETIGGELGDRKEHAFRDWYSPETLESYNLYRDISSVGYVHMLVDREKVEDRYRVFISKH